MLFLFFFLLCVLGANNIAAGITLLGVALHLLIISENGKKEAQFLVMAAALGILVDTLWQNLGILKFPVHEGTYAEGLIPTWLMAIWLAFATTLRHALSWMRRYRHFPFFIALVAGPMAYIGAAALGPIEIGYGPWGVVALATGWTIVFPLQLRIRDWLDQPDTFERIR